MSERPVYQIDREALPFVVAVESTGLHVDLKAAAKLLKQLERKQAKCLASLQDLVGDSDFNPASFIQVGDFLASSCSGYLKRTPSGRVATDKKTLARISADQPEFTTALTLYRHQQKMIGTYLRPLPEKTVNGCIYPRINYTGPVSGRWADRKGHYPMLTIPVRDDLGKQMRGLFGPAPGMLIGTWDLSQIEVRVAAHLSQDPILLDLCRSGGDMHDDTRDAFGVPRIVAKTVNFGIFYGISGQALADQLLVAGVAGYTAKSCDALIEQWFARYAGVAAYVDQTTREATRTGYVEDMWGRRRYLPALRLPRGVSWSMDKTIEEAGRQAFNHKIQPSVAGLIKRAMKRITDSEMFRSGRLQPLLQIHDEILNQFKPAHTKAVDKLMRSALLADADLFSVPIDCSSAWGQTWGELKD